jgi:hypothetical protein
MIDRASEIRSVADARNAVNGQPACTLARGCSGRFTTDNKTPVIGFKGGSVGVESLTMSAKMAQRIAVTVAIYRCQPRERHKVYAGNAHYGGNCGRNSVAIHIQRLTFDLSGWP